MHDRSCQARVRDFSRRAARRAVAATVVFIAIAILLFGTHSASAGEDRRASLAAAISRSRMAGNVVALNESYQRLIALDMSTFRNDLLLADLLDLAEDSHISDSARHDAVFQLGKLIADGIGNREQTVARLSTPSMDRFLADLRYAEARHLLLHHADRQKVTAAIAAADAHDKLNSHIGAIRVALKQPEVIPLLLIADDSVYGLSNINLRDIIIYGQIVSRIESVLGDCQCGTHMTRSFAWWATDLHAFARSRPRTWALLVALRIAIEAERQPAALARCARLCQKSAVEHASYTARSASESEVVGLYTLCVLNADSAKYSIDVGYITRHIRDYYDAVGEPQVLGSLTELGVNRGLRTTLGLRTLPVSGHDTCPLGSPIDHRGI